MKTMNKTTGLILMIFGILVASGSFAQERRHHADRDDKHCHENKHDHHSRNKHNYCNHCHHDNRYSKHSHQRHAAPWSQAPRSKTRYVYFRDYNVYYDYKRNVYLTLSGRNWAISTEVPLPMRRVDVRRIAYADVDFYGDDLYYYHTHRPYTRTIVIGR